MIKNSQRQTGSAHIAIIIILIVAVLGLLGFVFWQNFLKENVVSNTNTGSSQEEPTGIEQPEEGTLSYRSVVIGIEFAYPEEWLKIECDDTYVSDPQNRVYFGTTNEGLAIVDGKDTQLCGGGSDFLPQMSIALVTHEGDFDNTYTDVTIDGKNAKKITNTTGQDSIQPGLEMTRYFVDKGNGEYIAFSYNRYPAVSDSGRDNSDSSLQTFIELVEQKVQLL